MRAACRPPIYVDRLLDEPDRIRDFLQETAPHYPVQRYFSNAAEQRAQSGGSAIIAPNFRGDWATLEVRVPGVEFLLEHERLREAAAKLFDSEHVVPWGVYSNITWQLPFDQGKGHTDVPAFVGVDRSRIPTWFLSTMGHSGLFESERIDIATAVSWFYHGKDGGFTYWPDGPDKPPHVHEGEIFNTGFVGDNDRMYHRVRPVGRRENGLLTGMSLESRLEHDGADAWAIRQNGVTQASMVFADLRISVSWKAYVYRDVDQMRRHAAHSDALSVDEVVDRFLDDLASRGVACDRPTDPLHEPAFVDVLTRAYVQTPSVFES